MFHLANLENIVTPRKVLCIVGIASLHIIASGFDQFIANVFKGEGLLHQVHITIEIKTKAKMNVNRINQKIKIFLHAHAHTHTQHTNTQTAHTQPTTCLRVKSIFFVV